MRAIKQSLTQDFSVVSLTERFDETLLMLQKEGLVQNTSYKATHKYLREFRPRFDDLAPEDRAAIKRHNDLDQEIYNFAVQLFESRVTQAGPEFQRKLREHREIQKQMEEKHGSPCEDDASIFGNWKCDPEERLAMLQNRHKRSETIEEKADVDLKLLRDQRNLNALKEMLNLEPRYWCDEKRFR